MPAAPGSRQGTFGGYRLLRFLGAGGMGEVYCAEQQVPKRIVALKLLRPGTRCAAVLRRFDREAEVLARLQHPAIVRVLDAGVVATAGGDEPFLTMDYVEGSPLLPAVEQLRLDLPDRIRLLIEICEAIEHAHQRGVIHRDLKPDNVLLEILATGPRPRLLDFGIALSATDHRDDDAEPSLLVGTLEGMSPEQTRGDVGVRTDVYSLGALGYRLLTGRQPLTFQGLDLAAAIAHLQHAVPPLASTHVARLRGDLDAILAKALHKDPGQRHASAAALADDLRRHLQRLPVLARRYSLAQRSIRTLQRHRAAAVLLGLLGLSAAAAGLGITNANLRAAASDGERAALLAALADRIGPLLEEFGGTRGVRQQLLAELEPRAANLLAAAPDDPTALRVHTSLLTLRANMHRDANEVEAGRACRDRALAALTLLWSAAPGDLAVRRQLAVALVCRGDVDKDGGDDAAALPRYEAAHVHFLALQQAMPVARQPSDDLGWSYIRLAEARLNLGDLRQAGALLQACREQVQFLELHFADCPTTVALAVNLHNVSSRNERAWRRPDLAEQHERQALALAERLHAMSPQHLGYLLALVMTCASHARLAFECGELHAAGEMLRRGAPHAAELANMGAGNRYACDGYGMFATHQAVFAAHTGNWTDAIAATTRAYGMVASLPGIRASAFIRDQIAYGVAHALCGLDQLDAAVAAALLQHLRTHTGRGDRTHWERAAELLAQAQCDAASSLPATIAECGQAAAAGQTAEFERLAAAIAHRRLGELQPLRDLLAGLPDSDEPELAVVESRARRELAAAGR